MKYLLPLFFLVNTAHAVPAQYAGNASVTLWQYAPGLIDEAKSWQGSFTGTFDPENLSSLNLTGVFNSTPAPDARYPDWFSQPLTFVFGWDTNLTFDLFNFQGTQIVFEDGIDVPYQSFHPFGLDGLLYTGGYSDYYLETLTWFSGTVVSNPEPVSLALLGMGMLGALGLNKKPT